MANQVGDFFVQFSVEGMEDVTSALKSIGEGLAELGRRMAEVGEGMKGLAANVAAQGELAAKTQKEAERQAKEAAEAAKKAGSAWAQLAEAAAALEKGMPRVRDGLLAATAGIYGMATAGVWASSSGQVLGYQFQELGRQIASLFAPQVRWAIDHLGELVRWFQRLSGSQQAGLRNWALLVGGMTAFAFSAAPVMSGIKGLIAGFGGLQAAAVSLGRALTLLWASNPAALVIGAAVAAIVAAEVATDGWKSSLSALAEAAKQIVSPFEAVLVAIKDIIDALREWRGLEKDDRGLIESYFAERDRKSRVVRAPFEQLAQGQTGWRKSSLQAAGQYAGSMPMFGGLLGDLGDALGIKAWRQGEGRGELAPRLGGFEGIDQTYRRIAEASAKVGGVGGKSPQEQAVEKLEEISRSVQVIRDVADRHRNPTAR